MSGEILLHRALRSPEVLTELDDADWNRLIRTARTELLLATLAERARDIGPLPDKARLILEEAADGARLNQAHIGYEVDCMARALVPLGIPVVLMKGAAYLLGCLPNLPGRQIGDLDIMVPKARLGEAEAALKAHGWHSVKKSGGYDDHYYREWMHELPPLAHERRGNVIDLHHTILPRTARLRPDPERIFANAVPVAHGLSIMGPEDMLLHAAAHLAYDGDFQGGARNLWDIDRLSRHFSQQDGFWQRLGEAARAHELSEPLARSLRLAEALYRTPSPGVLRGHGDPVDALALRKMRGLDRFGQRKAPVSDFLLYLRGHWLRMPPGMLARHLFTKWRARRREARQEAVPTHLSPHPRQAPPPAGRDNRSGTE